MMAQVQKFVKNHKFAQSELQQYLDGKNLNTPILNQSSENQLPKREPIKHLLIGSPKAVTSDWLRQHRRLESATTNRQPR